MRIKPFVITFAAAGLVAAAAFAANLKPFQKEAAKKFDEEVKSYMDEAEKACGVKFTLKTNFEALKADEWEGQSISSRCTEMFSALTSVCGKEAYKEELAKNIKEVHCLFGGKAGDSNAGTKANMSVKGKAFVFNMHPNNVNLGDNAKEVIEKKLNE